MNQRTYKICTHCVMDTSDHNIQFDQAGVCNHCHNYEVGALKFKQIPTTPLDQLFQKLKENGKGKPYDAIMGLSGGVDSSYLAWLAAQNGVRVLAIHLDNGWNSEIAVQNIYNIVNKLNFDLYTHVIDWEEFASLQRAFLKADVIDIELLSDHAIFSVIMNQAKKHGIRYILSGANFVTESILPKSWVHRKSDFTHIKAINKIYGERSIKTFPHASTFDMAVSTFVRGYKTLKPLNHIQYVKSDAMEIIKKELGWVDYGGKHYESLFTKFYQAYILPTKFHVDKRRAHLSNLICSGQMTRDQALAVLDKPLYEKNDFERDKDLFLKKLSISEEFFQEYLKRPEKQHSFYKTDDKAYKVLLKIKEMLKYEI